MESQPEKMILDNRLKIYRSGNILPNTIDFQEKSCNGNKSINLLSIKILYNENIDLWSLHVT